VSKSNILGLLILTSTTMAEEHAKVVSNGNNALANKLYTALNQKGQNIFFSPISVHTIISLLHQGAEGDTESELRAALSIPEKGNSALGFQKLMQTLNSVTDVTLEMANKVYVMQGLNMKAAFKEVAVKNFFAEAENVNFAENVPAAKLINDWVEKKTNNKIKDLISPDGLDAMTRMVLVNAIYFKGDWQEKFKPENTKTKPFHIDGGTTVDCQMMFMKKRFSYKEDEALDAKVIRIPYKNQNVSFVAVLPNKVDGIAALEDKLQGSNINDIVGNMRTVEVELSLPKFKVETNMELNQPLMKIGFSKMFSRDANLKGLLESGEDLYISKAIQKAFIEVNEEGSEAAAATGMMVRCMMIMNPITFEANHPFLYFITYKAGENPENCLFYGKLESPK